MLKNPILSRESCPKRPGIKRGNKFLPINFPKIIIEKNINRIKKGCVLRKKRHIEGEAMSKIERKRIDEKWLNKITWRKE